MEGLYRHVSEDYAFHKKFDSYQQSHLDTGYSISTSCFLSDDDSSQPSRMSSDSNVKDNTSAYFSDSSIDKKMIRTSVASYESFEYEDVVAPLGVYSTLPKNFKKSDSLTWEICKGLQKNLTLYSSE